MTYRFQLRELNDFALALRETNKKTFVDKFATCLRMLLFDRRVHALSPEEKVSSAFSFLCEDYENDWVLLKEMVDFLPDYRLMHEVALQLRYISYCKHRLRSLGRFARGRKMRLFEIRELTFQDMFSVATSYFIIMGWGNGKEFKELFATV